MHPSEPSSCEAETRALYLDEWEKRIIDSVKISLWLMLMFF